MPKPYAVLGGLLLCCVHGCCIRQICCVLRGLEIGVGCLEAWSKGWCCWRYGMRGWRLPLYRQGAGCPVGGRPFAVGGRQLVGHFGWADQPWSASQLPLLFCCPCFCPSIGPPIGLEWPVFMLFLHAVFDAISSQGVTVHLIQGWCDNFI